jgi:hypothetical protein
MLIFALSSVLLSIATRAVEAQVTVYGQTPLAHQSTAVVEGEAPLPTLAAYDGLVLTPPTPPTPAVTALALNVARDAAAVTGLSIPHTRAGFFGFSVEMSVITQTSTLQFFFELIHGVLIPFLYCSWKEFVSNQGCCLNGKRKVTDAPVLRQVASISNVLEFNGQFARTIGVYLNSFGRKHAGIRKVHDTGFRGRPYYPERRFGNDTNGDYPHPCLEFGQVLTLPP